MPQEPITHHFNLKKDGGGHDLISAVLRKPKKPDAAVIENRKKMMAAGAEFKTYQDNGNKEKLAKRNELWLRAALNGDTETMARIQKTFDIEAKSMVAAGEMTEIEYKTLSPWAEGNNSQGGYNAPPAYVGDLARNLAEYAICRNHFRIQGMKSWKENIPYLVNKPTVAPIAENTAMVGTKITEANLLLTAYKAYAIMAATNEMIEDANFPLWAAFQDTAWEQFGIQEDTNGLQNLTGNFGPGALYYGGGTLSAMYAITSQGAVGVWRGGSSSSGKTGFPQIGDAASTSDAWQDLLYMLNGLPSGYYKKGKFFIDQNVAIAMFSMRDSQNRFIADIVNGITVEMGLDGQPKIYFRGYEMVIVPAGIMLNANTQAYTSGAVPSTPFTFFCNPERAWLTMGMRGGFRVDMLREGTIDTVSLAANDLQAIRMVERFAFGCAQPNTMVVLRTSAT